MKILVNKKLQSSIVLFFLINFNQNTLAQDSTFGRWMMDVRINYGFIIAHRPTVVHLQDAHVFGIEAELFRTTNGEKDWEQAYNRPLTGIGFQYWNLGNDKELGNAYTLFPQILFPLNHSPHLRFSTRIACGLGYIEKTFDRLENHKNVATSTHINCMISFGLYARTLVKKKTQIVTGIEFTHMSNGGFKVPNLGLNIPTLNLGVSHFFGQRTPVYPERKVKENRSTSINMLVAGGIKEITPPGGKKYGAFTITSTLSRSLGIKSSIGIGLDVFYDPSIETQLKGDSVAVPNFTYSIRSGIHLSYELKVQKLSMLFENGYYFYTHLPDDGNIYTRLCLRYHFTEKYFVLLNLKSHFGKADYFEYGIGMRLKQKSGLN